MSNRFEIWKDYDDLTVIHGGYLLLGIEPLAHEYRCTMDDEYDEYSSNRGILEDVFAQTRPLVSAIYAKTIHVTLVSKLPDDTWDVTKTRISKASFADWCRAHNRSELANWITGIHPPDLGDPAPKTSSSESRDQLPWIANARAIGLELKKRSPHLSQAQIAQKVQKKLNEKNDAGEKGMTGRGDRVPQADTIKRRALKGI